MLIEDLTKQNELFEIFINLVQIPSPSMDESRVAKYIVDFFTQNGISAKLDEFGNVTAKIEGNCEGKKPILLSAHMDVVGDNSPINPQIDEDKFIATDKTRTLGADDKAGVACAMLLAKQIRNSDIKHGGLEILFTRDEEINASGIRNSNLKEFESKYVLVMDSDKLGEVLIAGASYTSLFLEVHSVKSGHSGVDIHLKDRVNAAHLIAELIAKIPQGVYKADEMGTVTSINLGAIVAGGVENCLKNLSGKEIGNYTKYAAQNCMTNIINPEAYAKFSIRSSEKDTEEKLKDEIIKTIEEFNRKYNGLATATATIAVHLPPFEKSDDDTIPKVGVKAAENIGIKAVVSSFHAGAETRIYANETNKFGERFVPCLLGVADIYDMHCAQEHIDIKSFEKGFEFVKEMFKIFNQC